MASQLPHSSPERETCRNDSSNANPIDTTPLISLAEFQKIVKSLVIDRLDHKHLNLDVEYFSYVNPTVENIAQAIFDWLNGQFGSAQLQSVRVYETAKTWAECTADH